MEIESRYKFQNKKKSKLQVDTLWNLEFQKLEFYFFSFRQKTKKALNFFKALNLGG